MAGPFRSVTTPPRSQASQKVAPPPHVAPKAKAGGGRPGDPARAGRAGGVTHTDRGPGRADSRLQPRRHLRHETGLPGDGRPFGHLLQGAPPASARGAGRGGSRPHGRDLEETDPGPRPSRSGPAGWSWPDPLTELGRRRQPSSGPGNPLPVPVPASARFRFRRAPPPPSRRRRRRLSRRLSRLFCFDFSLRPRGLSDRRVTHFRRARGWGPLRGGATEEAGLSAPRPSRIAPPRWGSPPGSRPPPPQTRVQTAGWEVTQVYWGPCQTGRGPLQRW